MTSQKQTDSNRRNALLSTGPRTESGKQQSRRNAFRHGLTAETVIAALENAADYQAFESDIVTEYDPRSMVERELTLRLASLLWRMRRASLIETGLLRIPAATSQPQQGGSNIMAQTKPNNRDVVIQLAQGAIQSSRHDSPTKNRGDGGPANGSNDTIDDFVTPVRHRLDKQRVLTQRFLQLTGLAGEPFQRIGRYEARLWRQFVQVLFALDQAKHHRIVASRGRFTPYPPQW